MTSIQQLDYQRLMSVGGATLSGFKKENARKIKSIKK